MRADAVAAALNAKRVGAGWIARCPAHDDRNPSLSIRATADGTAILKCFAGCERSAILDHLEGRVVNRRTDPTSGTVSKSEAERTRLALRIWSECIPGGGTPVENYLRSRGITLPVPADLRFTPLLRHSSGVMLPAMVALVRDANGAPVALHRTFLTHDGTNKANVMPSKMMLGPCGRATVRLGDVGVSLLVGEGVETSLSAMTATGIPAWAALSASGLRGIIVPTTVTDIVVLADGDAAGEAAAQVAARRLQRPGRRVRIARPPAESDFNDLLVSMKETGGAR